MQMINAIHKDIRESIRVKRRLGPKEVKIIAHISAAIVDTLSAGNKLLIFGNGGSAADAQHIAAELVGRYQAERKALAAVALTTDSSILTAVGNDYAFEDVFARQISALGNPGDIALAISTTGNSPNVLKGLHAARSVGMSTVGFSGRTGGKMKALVDYCLCVPSDVPARIQESHILVGHIICSLVEKAFVVGSRS